MAVQTGRFIEFLDLQSLPTTASGEQSVAVGDLTGDGKPDMVWCLNSAVAVLLNRGDGSFNNATTYAAGNAVRAVAVADVTGDGKLDIITANYNDDNCSVLLGNGDGTFQAASATSSAGDSPLGIIVDKVMTSNPNRDIIAVSNTDQRINVLLGNGNGTFQTKITTDIGFNAPNVLAGDLTGDGNLDLVIYRENGSEASVFLGNGNGTFQPGQTLSAGTYLGGLALGDLTGDGKIDLVFANNIPQTVTVLLGNGDGTFQSPTTTAIGKDAGRLALADLTGDGRLDLVVQAPSDGVVGIMLGNGNGTFQSPVEYATAIFAVKMLAVDFRNIGVMDILQIGFVGTNGILYGIPKTNVRAVSRAKAIARVSASSRAVVTRPSAGESLLASLIGVNGGGGPTAYGVVSIRGGEIQFVYPITSQFGGTVNWVALSPDSRFMAIVTNSNPLRVQVFPLSVLGLGPAVASPATPPTGDGRAVVWSPDGNYIAVAHQTSPFVSVYPWAGGAFGIKLADPATPAASGLSVQFRPQGDYILLNRFIYQWNNGFGTQTSIASASSARTSWSHDGNFIALVNSIAPFLHIYPFSGGSVGAEIAAPAVPPTSNPSAPAFWSPDGRYVGLVQGSTAPFIYEWSISGFGAMVASPLDGVTIGANARYAKWSRDGRYFVFGTASGGGAEAGRLFIYEWDNGYGRKLPVPQSIQPLFTDVFDWGHGF